MIIGPIFVREALTAPRPLRHYLQRACYGTGLFVLMWTAWQSIVGFQRILSAGDMARFGVVLFQLLSLIQLALALFFAAVVACNSICSEKDRRTFVLLLMTDLTNHEIVLGKLLASLLQMAVMLATAVPIFALCLLLGGVSAGQVARVFAVTAAVALASGSLGILIACWRDKTFQALALTFLILALYLVLVEVLHGWIGEGSLLGHKAEWWRAMLNPFFAVLAVIEPVAVASAGAAPLAGVEWSFVAVMVAVTLVLTGTAIAMLRVWNPGRDRVLGDGQLEVDEQVERERAAAAPARPARTRPIWDNPILWREIRTRAYGRRPLLIKLAYLLAFLLICGGFMATTAGTAPAGRMDVAKAFVPIVLTSLILVNIQAVTSVTSERDGRSLDLLLVSDITPKEFIFGKLGGIAYNTKEMILLPLAFCLYLLVAGLMPLEAWIYVVAGMLVLFAFSGALGLHAALSYRQTRLAVLNSLGTIVFLFIGILVCVFLILISGRFESQAVSFVLFICAGAVAMYASLAVRNPSSALALASFLCPTLTWWAIAQFLRGGDPLGCFLIVAGSYGFAVLAMLVPAVSEFDVALGRTVAAAEG